MLDGTQILRILGSKSSKQPQRRNTMNKFTTFQLQNALVELRARPNSDSEAFAAYQMVFSELNERMGDDAFDAWLDGMGW